MIVIRNALVEDYEQIEAIMQQVQQMYVSWRSDIYCPSSPVLSLKFFQQLLKEHSLFVAEYDGVTAGVMILEQRHIENPTHVTMDILFVDTMAVDEKYRHKGIGHAFFDYVKTNNAALVLVTHDKDIAQLCDIKYQLSNQHLTQC